MRFRYYAWLIWIPRSAVVKVGDVYTAPPWAIDSAKEHASARHYRDDDEAREVSAEIRGVGPVERGSVLTPSREQSRTCPGSRSHYCALAIPIRRYRIP